jgi:hypothetical protein
MKPTAFLAIIVATLMPGCCILHPTPACQSASYWQIETELANQLNRQFGSDTWWQIVPLPAGDYPLGYVLDGGFPLTTKCSCSTNDLQGASMQDRLPQSLTNTSAINISLGFPTNWAPYFTGSFGITNTNYLFLSYSNLTIQYINPDVYRNALKNGDCKTALDEITNHPAIMLVGYVYAQKTLTSFGGFDANLQVKTVSNAGMALSLDHNGGFTLQDTNAVPSFAIVSHPLVPSERSVAATTSETLLQKPSFKSALAAVMPVSRK